MKFSLSYSFEVGSLLSFLFYNKILRDGRPDTNFHVRYYRSKGKFHGNITYTRRFDFLNTWNVLSTMAAGPYQTKFVFKLRAYNFSRFK